MNNQPIGIFDSGIGGLTVLQEVVKQLPHEDIIYIGDTARVPWGIRGKETIIEFSFQLAHFLLKKKVKLIVIACHTASSVALVNLKKEIKIPIFGVVEPSVEQTISATKNLRVGIIGTPATIKSNAWGRALRKRESKLKVFSNACPLFVPLIEEGLLDHKATKIIAREYLQPLLKQKIDTLILACTHFPLLTKVIKEVVGSDVALINPGKAVVQGLAIKIKRENLAKTKKKGKIDFYFTDLNYKPIEKIKNFLGSQIHGKIERVSLEF